MGQNRPRSRFGAVLALVALALQCFVIETHVDGLAWAPAIERASVTTQSEQGAPASCIICQEAAIGRTGLLAGAPAIHRVEHTLSFAVILPRQAVREARPTQPWQSRAPPILA